MRWVPHPCPCGFWQGQGGAFDFLRPNPLARAKEVRIGGGAATIRLYIAAGAIDEIHLAMSPVLLGEGEHLFAGINLHQLRFQVLRRVEGTAATHLILQKR